MSHPAPEAPNPFDPPRAEIGRHAFPEIEEGEVERIRRAHLSHEASIKSIGSLYYLGAILQAISIATQLLLTGRPNQFPGQSPENAQILKAMQVGSATLSMALQFALGYGLTHLQPWARWTVLVFTVLGLILVPLVCLGLFVASPPIAAFVLLFCESILGYIVYLLVSAKGGVVFSRQYREIIEKTPQIKYKTSIILKILLGVILVLIILGVVGALMRRWNG